MNDRWRHFRLSPGARGWLSVLLLAGLPLFFLWAALEHGLATERETNRELGRVRFQSLLQRMAVPQKLEPAINAVLGNVWDGSIQRQTPLLFLQERFSELKTRFPDAFSFAVFQPDGHLIASLSDLPEHHPLLERLGLDLKDDRQGDHDPLQRDFPLFRPLLGPTEILTRSTYATSRSHRAALEQKRGLVYFSDAKPGKPWFVAWIRVPTEATELAFRLYLRLRTAQDLDLASGFIDLRHDLTGQARLFGAAGPLVVPALLAMGEEEGGILERGGFFWGQFRVSAKVRLLLCFRDRSEEGFEDGLARLRTGLAILLLVSMLVWQVLAARFTLTLRTRLLLLFLYTSGMPLCLLGLSAQGLTKERRDLMERLVGVHHERVLAEVGRSMTRLTGSLENRVRQECSPPLPDGKEGDAEARRRLARLVRRTRPQMAVWSDRRGGDPVVIASGTGASYRPLIAIIRAIAQHRAAGMETAEIDPGGDARDLVLEAAMEDMGIDLGYITTLWEMNWRQMVPVQSGNERAETIAYPLEDRNGRYRGGMFLLWGDAFFQPFLTKILLKYQRKMPEPFLGLYHESKPFPPSFPAKKELTDLLGSLEVPNIPVQSRFDRNGEGFLLTGIRTLGQGNLPLFALSTDRAIHEEIVRTAIRLSLTGTLSMFLGLGIGLLLTRQFLTPLRHFAEGMVAIQARDFTHRVPVSGPDELQRLAATLNSVMAEMADLEVAGVLQATVFPAAPLHIGGWEIHGTWRPAKRVGGDYFDFFPLPDGRVLLVVGDATGHGVAAALVVAMAKAVICHPATPTRPSWILQVLHDQIRRTANAGRAMTCFLGIFDPRSGVLEAGNAGHPYPYLIRDGRAIEVAVVHPPLGFRRKIPFVDREIQVGNGDCLCLFTDGMIEAVTTKGEATGFQRFGEALPGLVRRGATATEAAIREWFDILTDGAPLADDTTLVIMQRRTKEGK